MSHEPVNMNSMYKDIYSCAQLKYTKCASNMGVCVFIVAVVPRSDEFVRDLFVKVCLDFSIAQYMEDCSPLSEIQKKKDLLFLD